MLSPHISSAFAEERQARYRHEAEVQRLARTRAVRRTGTRARTVTADPPARLGTPSCRPSPAH